MNLNGLRPPVVIYVNYTAANLSLMNLNGLRPPVVIFVNYTAVNLV